MKTAAQIVRIDSKRDLALLKIRTDRQLPIVWLGGNEKLACKPETDKETGKTKRKTVIETKGEGGYCLAPPSPAGCHPLNKCYRFVDGKDLTMVPTISFNQG